MSELPPIQYIKFNTKRCFGIELEVAKNRSLDELVNVVRTTDPKRHCMGSNHYQQDAGNDFWHVKFDRSCGAKIVSGINEGGWEVASYKASGAADLIKLSNMGDMLKKAGAEVNDNCGYHIHVEILDFNISQAATFVQQWMKLERMILEMLPKSRRNNPYCQLLSDIKSVTAAQASKVDTFWARVRPASFDNAERRVALNMCNYVLGTAAKKTAELRLPEGTLDSKEIKNWARLFIHFVNTCRTAPFAGNILTYTDLKSAMTALGLHNDDPFYLLSKGMYETKTWFLNRVLKYSDKKVLQAEAAGYLDVLIPPSPEDKVESDELKESGKKKKRKLDPDGREYRTRLRTSDFWEPYEDVSAVP